MSRLFGEVAHQAFVVPDFDKGLQQLLDAGIGPAFVLRRIRGAGHYRGERHDPLISAAFAFSGDTCYEVLTPLDGVPSTYREYLERHPDGGMHHIAYMSSDFAATMKAAADAGSPYEVVQDYFDPASGFAYEVYMEPVGAEDPIALQLVLAGTLDDWFAKMREMSRGWDGSNPIRDALDLMPADMRPVSEPA